MQYVLGQLQTQESPALLVKVDACVHDNQLEKCKAKITATMERMVLYIFFDNKCRGTTKLIEIAEGQPLGP